MVKTDIRTNIILRRANSKVLLMKYINLYLVNEKKNFCFVNLFNSKYLMSSTGDSLSGHNGFGFSTQDVDNDSKPDGSCARYIQGAWWFHNCADSCLTCAYLTPGVQDCQSMYWSSHANCVSLRSAKMMVRPL